MSRYHSRAVVFDLDSTIGDFSGIGLLINGIQNAVQRPLPFQYIHHIFGLFPGVFHPELFMTLKLLKLKKAEDPQLKVIIYTNNTGPRSWTMLIRRYLETLFHAPIFDAVITGHRPRDHYNCRNTSMKTYSDLIRCGGLPSYTHVLFIDDQQHPYMLVPKVSYYHMAPYYHNVTVQTLIQRVFRSRFACDALAFLGGQRPPLGRDLQRNIVDSIVGAARSSGFGRFRRGSGSAPMYSVVAQFLK